VTRKRFNTVTIAAMIAILALGGLGLGYAAWSDQININASADTGEAEIVWVSGSVVEKEFLNGTEVAVSYALCDGQITAPDNINATAEDIFPGYKCYIAANVKNEGTVPMEIYDVAPDPSLAGSGFDAGCTVYVLNPGDTTTCWATVEMAQTVTSASTMNKSYSGNVKLLARQHTP
jgi:hypothetical protein